MFWRSTQSGAPELERQSERGSLCHICVLLIHRGDVSNFRCEVVGVVGVVSVPFLLFPQLVSFVETAVGPSAHLVNHKGHTFLWNFLVSLPVRIDTDVTHYP